MISLGLEQVAGASVFVLFFSLALSFYGLYLNYKQSQVRDKISELILLQRDCNCLLLEIKNNVVPGINVLNNSTGNAGSCGTKDCGCSQ